MDQRFYRRIIPPKTAPSITQKDQLENAVKYCYQSSLQKLCFFAMNLIHLLLLFAGLMKAGPKEALTIFSVVITSSLALTTSTIINRESSYLRQSDGLKEAILATDAISAIKLRISPEQTQHFEMTTATSKDLGAPRATQRVAFIARSIQVTTSSIRSSRRTEVSTSTTVSASHVGGYNLPASIIEPSSAALTSAYQLSSLTFNSTVNLHDGQTDVNDECDSDACDTYVTRWVDFYLNVSKKKLFF